MSTERYAVVTGASSGIGAELAKELVRRGYRVILVARREDKLLILKKKLDRWTKDAAAEVLASDLATEEGQKALFEYTADKNVEILINNAGFGDCGYFEQTSLEKDLAMIDLNVKTMHTLMKHYLQEFRMKEKAGIEVAKKEKTLKRFYILNVASSAGLLPGGAFMATYYATKAYVTSLTRAVREELRKENSYIYVGALCPGPVDTEFNEVADVEFALKGISPKYCAKTALSGMFRRKGIIVPTLRMKLACLGARLVPAEVAVRTTANQQKKKM